MTEEIKVRQPKVRKPKMTEDEQKALEKAEKKEEKLVDIETMLNAFSMVSARASYSNKRTASCASAISRHIKVVEGSATGLLHETHSKLALDINGTTTAQKLAYEAFQALDKVIKEMRMNPWKKIIVKLRGEMFDQLHADMVLIDQLSVDFGKIAENQGTI